MSEWFFVFVVALFGLIIGSFLNVVIYRFHTNRSLNDRSHCLSCGHSLAWYELFPLLSYACLWGRCSYCRAYIPVRYLTVELLTGLAFLLVWSYTNDVVVLVLLAAFVSVLMVITVYDLYHMIIPNELVVALGALSFGLIGYQNFSNLVPILTQSILAGTLASASFGSLWLYSKGRWIGLGDAKLAFPLGMLVGISQIFSLIVLSFWTGAIISLIIIGFQEILSRGQKHLRFLPRTLKMKSEIPFAPFLIGAFLLVFFCSVDVLDLTASITTHLYGYFTF